MLMSLEALAVQERISPLKVLEDALLARLGSSGNNNAGIEWTVDASTNKSKGIFIFNIGSGKSATISLRPNNDLSMISIALEKSTDDATARSAINKISKLVGSSEISLSIVARMSEGQHSPFEARITSEAVATLYNEGIVEPRRAIANLSKPHPQSPPSRAPEAIVSKPARPTTPNPLPHEAASSTSSASPPKPAAVVTPIVHEPKITEMPPPKPILAQIPQAPAAKAPLPPPVAKAPLPQPPLAQQPIPSAIPRTDAVKVDTKILQTKPNDQKPMDVKSPEPKPIVKTEVRPEIKIEAKVSEPSNVKVETSTTIPIPKVESKPVVSPKKEIEERASVLEAQKAAPVKTEEKQQAPKQIEEIPFLAKSAQEKPVEAVAPLPDITEKPNSTLSIKKHGALPPDPGRDLKTAMLRHRAPDAYVYDKIKLEGNGHHPTEISAPPVPKIEAPLKSTTVVEKIAKNGTYTNGSSTKGSTSKAFIPEPLPPELFTKTAEGHEILAREAVVHNPEDSLILAALQPLSSVAKYLAHHPLIQGNASLPKETLKAISNFINIKGQSSLSRVFQAIKFTTEITKSLRDDTPAGNPIRNALERPLSRANVSLEKYASELKLYTQALRPLAQTLEIGPGQQVSSSAHTHNEVQQETAS